MAERIYNYKGIKVTLNKNNLEKGISSALSDEFAIEKGEQYTVQFKIINLNNSNILDYITIGDGKYAQKLQDVTISEGIYVGGIWETIENQNGESIEKETHKEYLCSFTFTSEFDSENARLSIGRRHLSIDKDNTDIFLIRYLKMEYGDVATDWTPYKTDQSSEIKILSNEISMKVTEGDVYSLIRQSSSAVEFAFNQISPSVTIDADGITLGKGCRVACDAITVPPGSAPIIRLFDNCAIDATKSNGQGKGDAIRLKWDELNYLMVKPQGISMYLGDDFARMRFGRVDTWIESQRVYLGMAKGEHNPVGASVICKGWLYVDEAVDFKDPIMKIGSKVSEAARFDANGTALRIWGCDRDTGIRIHDDGDVGTYNNGTCTWYVYSYGSKWGGFIDVDGANLGMSPIDSPRMLIEDILFDEELSGEEQIIKLNETYVKTIGNQYAVFPSNGKVDVIAKEKGYFIVKGYKGKCDFKVTGKRVDSQDVYFGMVGGDF